MGKKKKRKAEDAVPPVYKKQKLYKEDGSLSCAGALYEYCARMKLGRVGYRMLSRDPWLVSCVLTERDMCQGKGATRAAALEKAARGTLVLLDPTARSILANLPCRDEAMLEKLRKEVERAATEKAHEAAWRRPASPAARA